MRFIRYRVGVTMLLALIMVFVGATASYAVATSVNGETIKPDGFGWSGGSGRLEYIKCQSLQLDGDQYIATIEFASENYDKVKVNGEIYTRINTDGNSTFEIPVSINKNTKLSGRTTAMSQAHWVDYNIYVALKFEGNKLSTKTTINSDKLNDKAPRIMGLAKGREIKTEGQLFKIFKYGKIALLQIDLSTRSVMDGRVANYLIVPNGTELTAGLDQEITVIRGKLNNPFEGDDVDFSSLVTDKNDAVILPASTLKGFFFNKNKKIEKVQDIESSCKTLGIPVIVDRADSERGADAKAAWNKVYKILGIEK